MNKITQLTGLDQQRFIFAEQIHGTQVAVVTDSLQAGPLPGADGIITNRKDVVLVVKHADCVPIFLFDAVKKVIGLVHSGWRGTVGKIGMQALLHMAIHFGTKPKDVQVGIGPAARVCCYRFDKDRKTLAKLPEWANFLINRDGSWYLDMVGFIKHMFQQCGIEENQIIDSEICSIHDRHYPSWTRQRDGGELKGSGVSVLGLRRVREN